MAKNKEVPRSALEIIMDQMFDKLKSNDSFDDRSLDGLRELSAQSMLTNQEKIEEVIMSVGGANENS